MKILAVVAIYAGAWMLCDRSEIIAGFAPFIGLALIPVAGKVLEG